MKLLHADGVVGSQRLKARVLERQGADPRSGLCRVLGSCPVLARMRASVALFVAHQAFSAASRTSPSARRAMASACMWRASSNSSFTRSVAAILPTHVSCCAHYSIGDPAQPPLWSSAGGQATGKPWVTNTWLPPSNRTAPSSTAFTHHRRRHGHPAPQGEPAGTGVNRLGRWGKRSP